MLTTQHAIDPLLLPPGSEHSGPHFEAAWKILDRFAYSLQERTETPDQVELSLEAVRDSLDADAVYWDPGSGPEGLACVGHADLSHAWCKALTSRLIASDDGQSDDGQILGTVPALPAMAAPGPVDAAMVRISRSFNSWIVAVNFTPGRRFVPTDLKIMSLARRLLLNHRHNGRIYGKLRESLFGLVRCLTAVIEAKDPYTCGHSERVARIGQRIGARMGLSGSELGDLYLAGLLHDIGKIGIRDDILLKPGALTPEEMAHIQQHPIIGDQMISSIRQLGHIRPGIRNHHERFDGNGYPDRLSGEGIPLIARVLAVADSFDAMMSARPYRDALSAARIDEIISGGAGRMWDPAIVGHFMACRLELYQDLPRGLGESMLFAVEQTINFQSEPLSTSFTNRR